MINEYKLVNDSNLVLRIPMYNYDSGGMSINS